MAVVPEKDTSFSLNKEVLLTSWARLSVYDRTASHLKSRFVQRRLWVIGLTLIATIASILTGILGETLLSVILAIGSVIISASASVLMNDIIKFTGTTAWIKYRYIAEMMRMHIYLYRMQADIYAVGPVNLMDNLLVEKLSKVRADIKMDDIIPSSFSVPQTEAEIVEVIKQANSGSDDDGVSEISIENYIKWRVDKPQSWYDSRIKTDFARLKLFYRWGQIILLIGSISSALAGFAINLQIFTLVAVTNAISVALTQWSNVSMVGKTYSIFQIASDELKDQKAWWLATVNDFDTTEEEKMKAAKSMFATRVENVLLWEREEWYEMALQAQAAGDKMILGDLTRLTQRAQDAQNKPAPK
ncbi:MAG: DUF4231 domain-containing protein [Chloroflexi bacterium]|nr:DUF4231 domain-containing protein [Chloroflexota bacterium]MCC6892808.1 DUF4231 domain-containing protein [Anaerolineae bacterium]